MQAAAVSVSAGLRAGYGDEPGDGRCTRVLEDVAFTLPAGRRLSVVGRQRLRQEHAAERARRACWRRRPARSRSDGVRVAAADLDGPGRPGCRSGHAAYMFQKDLLLPWRTVLGNAMLAAEAARGSPAGAAAAARPRRAERARAGTRRARPRCRVRRPSGRAVRRHAAARAPWRGRWWPARGSSCSTSRSAASIRSRAPTCAAGCSRPCAHTRATWVLVTHDVREAVLLGDVVAVLGGRPARLHGWVETRPHEDERSRLAELDAGAPAGRRRPRRERA